MNDRLILLSINESHIEGKVRTTHPLWRIKEGEGVQKLPLPKERLIHCAQAGFVTDREPVFCLWIVELVNVPFTADWAPCFPLFVQLAPNRYLATALKKDACMSNQNPYLNARREWDERYGGLISRARNWQLIAAGSLAVAVVAVVGIAFIGSQSKIQPFVVVTDQLGSPVAVARPAPVAKADFDKRLMVAQLAAFIKDVRSMLPDAVAQQVTLNRVYAMAGRDVAGFLNEFFKDNSPFSVDGSVTRVEISSVIPQGGETYQVSWVETKARPGATAVAEHWKAVVTVGVDAKLAENQKVALWNPFGIYVKSISWTKEVL